MKGRWFAAVAVLLLAGCGGSGGSITFGPNASPTTNPNMHAIDGALALNIGTSDPLEDFTTGQPCAGPDGFSDIADGAQVVIANESGTVIAVGTLQGGSATTPTTCLFAFSIPNVPKASVYEITISHRGAVDFTMAQMVAQAWFAQLTLGSSGP